METGRAFREGSAPDVRWHQRKDGTRVFIVDPGGMRTAMRAAARRNVSRSLIGTSRPTMPMTMRSGSDFADVYGREVRLHRLILNECMSE